MNSDLVIKVKYGDTLRRFGVFVHGNGALDLDMCGLRAKILNLFNFTPDADLTLTYIDEDNDVVTLVDDNDLHDAIRQRLNPLRINVLLSTNRAGRFETRSSTSSTPMRSSRIQSNPLSYINSGVEVLKSVPEPLRDALTKLSHDLASKAASSAPVLAVQEPFCDALSKLSHDFGSKAASSSLVVTELVEYLSKLGLSHLSPVSQCQAGATWNAQSNDSDSSMDRKVTDGPKASKDSVTTPEVVSNAKVVDPAPSYNPKEYDSGNMTRGVGTSVPPTTASVDLPKDSDESGYSSLANSIPLVLASNGFPNNRKKPQKECDVHLKEKSVSAGTLLSTSPADLLMHLNPQTSQASEAVMLPILPVRTSGGPGVLDGDSSKQLSIVHGHSSASQVGFNAQNNSPINGQMGVDASDVMPSGGFYPVHPFKRSYSHCDRMGRIFHKGVRCDGCGAHPITGPRFKSKVKPDYDLCSICFSELGNEAEYTRMDRPMSYRSLRSFRELRDPFQPPQFHSAPLPQVLRGCGMKPYRSKLDSRFIQDVNIADGTLMAPATPFTKIWRMRNNGTIAWPRGTQLVWIGGDQFNVRGSVEVEIPVEGCPVDKELDIAVDFTAPVHSGQYTSSWRMSLPSGQKFGQRVWVLIHVDASIQGSLSESFHGLNLNLPPRSSGSNGQIIDVNVEPVDGSHPESHSDMAAELVKPMVNEHPRTDHELDFPTNDDLLGSNGDSVPIPPEVPAAISYPIIDFSDDLLGSNDPFPVTDEPTFSGEVGESNMIEQTLLKELEEMGFMQINLNKEILRMNEYNLEQSVEDLCSVTEWDPILEELQEMGFRDKETNKKLLKKNGGSIKRVVLDLVAGEKS